MSKSARKIKPIHRHDKHEQKTPVSMEKRRMTKGVAILLLVGVLAGIPFAMGKYCEFNIPDAFDSGCYVYSAKHILDGAKLGVEEMPSAKVGTLLVNMLGVQMFGFSETGPKLIQTVLQAGALFVMFVVMLQLYGILPAAIGVILASTFLSAPIIAKYGNVKEQYMIAFMILGICSFVLGQLRGKWLYIMLAGAFVSLGPLFKETGLSAIGAIGLFVLAQPLLKHATWKKTGKDILLLFAGAAIFIAPISLWLAIEKSPTGYYPYAAFWMPVIQHFTAPKDNAAQQQPADTQTPDTAQENAVNNNADEPGFFLKMMPGYVRDSWMIMSAEQRKEAFERVFRWYDVLILPILLALGSIFLRIFRIFVKPQANTKNIAHKDTDRFVFLFATWWILDMCFVWISPRSYEQYYLPLNASAAMLSGYLIMAYRQKLNNIMYRQYWIPTGIVGTVLAIVLVWPIFFGVSKSPHSGDAYPEKRNGYAQRLREASAHHDGARGGWENIGEYIKEHTTPDDEIYVWGWYPGIYVAAQRMSPSPKAFEGTMHTLPPIVLKQRVGEILNSFSKHPPKFIVDSLKQHFPWDRPPLELWPITQTGFLKIDQPSAVLKYDQEYAKELAQRYGEDEALRYKAMNSFRIYVRQKYKIVSRREFGGQVLFQRKEDSQN